MAAAMAMVWGSCQAQDDGPIAGNALIAIPAGPFIFGNDEGNANERPRQTVDGRAFAINRTEISNAQYQRFVNETGHRSGFYAAHPFLGLGNRPVVGVSRTDAQAFCEHYGLHLPSEHEYERAARGVDGDPFPWGAAAPGPTLTNRGAETCCGGDDRDGYAMTAPVDSFAAGASREGVLNLVGNVWEWTRDFYTRYDGAADPQNDGKYAVLRGGAWNSDPAHLSTTYRLAYNPEFRFAGNGGFRCIRSAD